MQSISIERPTPKQLLKLRRGENVRIKRGTGFELNVHPENYNIVARAFNRFKGVQLGLSEEELKANMGISNGLQDLTPKEIPKFDSDGVALPAAPVVPRTQGPQQMNVGAANAMLGPRHQVQGHGLSGIRHPHKVNDMASQIHQVKHYDAINKQLGTNFDYMGSAGYVKALSDKMGSELSEASFKARHPVKEREEPLIFGSGFNHRTDRTVMGYGVSLRHNDIVPPALESQPYGVNFQFNHFLPPEFQTDKNIHGGSLHTHTHNLIEKTGYVKKHPHGVFDFFNESVVMPEYYTSKADDVGFVRQSTKNPESKPEAKHKKNKAIRKAKMGHGLYAGGSGHGLYAGGGLGP